MRYIQIFNILGGKTFLNILGWNLCPIYLYHGCPHTTSKESTTISWFSTLSLFCFHISSIIQGCTLILYSSLWLLKFSRDYWNFHKLNRVSDLFPIQLYHNWLCTIIRSTAISQYSILPSSCFQIPFLI